MTKWIAIALIALVGCASAQPIHTPEGVCAVAIATLQQVDAICMVNDVIRGGARVLEFQCQDSTGKMYTMLASRQI